MSDFDQQLKKENAFLAQQNYLAAKSLQLQQKQEKKSNGLAAGLLLLGGVVAYYESKKTQEQKQRTNQILECKLAKGEITQAEADFFKYPVKDRSTLWVIFFICLAVLVIYLLI